jgi:hypothetical protein
MQKLLTLGLTAAAFMLAAAPAQAGSHVSWSIGINVPGPVIYAPPPRVVYQPQPVYRYEAPPPQVVYSYPVETVSYPRYRGWAPPPREERHEHCEHRHGWRHHHSDEGYEREGRSWSREGYGRWNRWER